MRRRHTVHVGKATICETTLLVGLVVAVAGWCVVVLCVVEGVRGVCGLENVPKVCCKSSCTPHCSKECACACTCVLDARARPGEPTALARGLGAEEVEADFAWSAGCEVRSSGGACTVSSLSCTTTHGAVSLQYDYRSGVLYYGCVAIDCDCVVYL